MDKQKNYDATALLALPQIASGSTPEKGFLSWSRPYLIGQIRDKGVDVAVIRGADNLDPDQGIAKNVINPEYSGDEVKLHVIGDTALQSFNVMRTIVKTIDVDQFVPVLNPSDFRMHARNKSESADDILRPAGAYDRHSVLVTPGNSSVRELEKLPGSSFVAKPDNGRQSNGIKVGTRQEIAGYLSEQDTAFLVEEKIDFTVSLPQIKGIDDVQQARLDEANRLGVNKELRMYYFGNSAWDGTVRVTQLGETDFSNSGWLYIDQDSIPDEVYKIAAKIVDEIKKQYETDEVHIAFDFVFGSTASNPEPHWEVMEMNVGEPQLVRESEHLEISHRQHEKLATQIARIAVS